jgi:hypothetical protein
MVDGEMGVSAILPLTFEQRLQLKQAISDARRLRVAVETGCGCDLCIGERMGKTVLHGTETAYKKPYKCRCDECRTNAAAKRRARRRNPNIRIHNKSGYANGCRCSTCREAARIYEASRRAAKRQAAA